LSIPFLSVIIPAYNEEHRLPTTLDRVSAFLADQTYPSEILVVENGSQDRTWEIAQAYALRQRPEEDAQLGPYPPMQVLQIPERGKGLAVKRGMLVARGEYRFMLDADLSMPVTEINRFLPPVLVDFDIAIASREAPGAERIGEPAYRHVVGRVYNTLIRVLAVPGIQDTQCGFKCFRAEIAEDLFRRLTLSGWSFDVELLYLARRLGYRIQEIPIRWHFNPNSHISVVRDSLRMALDIFRIRLNGLQGKYGRPL
jgi:glycosyltransferase involved in cell wall biosynthesis